MAQSIKNGENGNIARVDSNNRLSTFAVNRTEIQQSVSDGNGYNINSGLVTLTTAGESGILYYKHNLATPFSLAGIIIIMGPSTGGATTDATRMRVYKNPTTGTLISAESAASINSNRDFGSANTLTGSLAYKGAEGSTITDGSTHIESLISPGNRVFFPASEVLRQGNSIAVSLEPNDSTTSMKVMVALSGNLEISNAS